MKRRIASIGLFALAAEALAAENARSIVGHWMGDARLFDRDIRAQAERLLAELWVEEDLAIHGNVGKARLPRTTPTRATVQRIEYRILLEGFVMDIPELKKPHLIIIVSPRNDGTLDADFHLKSRVGFDLTMRVGHFDVVRAR